MGVNEKMSAIADAIRDKTKGKETLTLDDMATEIPKVYEEGKKAERDDFWEEYYATNSWSYAFCESRWSDKNYNPPRAIKCRAGFAASGMYQNTTITDTKVPLDLSEVNGINYIFFNTKTLKTIRDITFPASGTVTNAFASCSNLENITVTGNITVNNLVFQACSLLTHDSLMSIVNALADYSTDTSGTMWKITLGATNLAKLSTEEIEIISDKGWQYG